MKNKKIVFCTVTTWVGSSVCYAEHFYARLRRRSRKGPEEIDLEYRVNSEEAKKLNEDDTLGTSAEYKAGETSERFFCLSKIKRVAAREYKKLMPGSELLILGASTTMEPQEILGGPPGLRRPANVIFRRCERLGWWDKGNDTTVQGLSDKWVLLLKKYSLRPW